MNYSEVSSLPFVGQLIHYHPDQHTRLAAIVTEVHPMSRDEFANLQKPRVSLFFFQADGKTSHKEDVPCADPDADGGLNSSWSFHNEVSIDQKEPEGNEEQFLGTQSNLHVGMM